MAKLTTAEFIDAIKELTVLELNDLVKACEEEFGVSAAAGVVVAAAGDGAAAAEEKDSFDVELTEVGPNKVKVIKAVSYTHLEGEIILKKYSPIGELGTFAQQYADSLAQTTGYTVFVTDRDSVIACAGGSKKDYLGKGIRCV